MRLTVQTDLSGTITRQELANMWSQASIPPITQADLDPAFLDIFVGSNFSDQGASLPNPDPGAMFWHGGHGLMFCFHDSLDVCDTGEKTGVSLWLAVGPDSFETACIAAEPLPAGAVVEPFYDRWVKVFRPDAGNFAGDTNAPTPLGVVQSGIPDEYVPQTEYGSTAESGAWVRVAIDGLARVWHPAPDRLEGNPSSAVSPGQMEIKVVENQFNYVGCPPSDSGFLGAVIGNGNSETTAGPYTVGVSWHNVTVASGHTAIYPWVHWQGHGCTRYRPDLQ